MANYKFSTEDEQKFWERVFGEAMYHEYQGGSRSLTIEQRIARADNAAQALFARLPLEDEPEDSLALEAAN